MAIDDYRLPIDLPVGGSPQGWLPLVTVILKRGLPINVPLVVGRLNSKPKARLLEPGLCSVGGAISGSEFNCPLSSKSTPICVAFYSNFSIRHCKKTFIERSPSCAGRPIAHGGRRIRRRRRGGGLTR